MPEILTYRSKCFGVFGVFGVFMVLILVINKCSDGRYCNDYYEDTTIFDFVEVDTAYPDNIFMKIIYLNGGLRRFIFF